VLYKVVVKTLPEIITMKEVLFLF